MDKDRSKLVNRLALGFLVLAACQRALTVESESGSNQSPTEDSNTAGEIPTPTKLPTATQTHTPTLTPTVTPTRYDYCVLDVNDSDPLSSMMAGTPVPTIEPTSESISVTVEPPVLVEEIFFESSLNESSLERITRSDVGSPTTNDNVFRVLLVPDGYEEGEGLEARMQEMVDFLQEQYMGVEVHFSYLKKDVPIGIDKIDRMAILRDGAEADRLMQRMQVIYPVDAVVVVVNTEEYMGSSGTHVVAAGENESWEYLLKHETAHRIGLDDGYPRFMGVEGVHTSTEIFTSTLNLGDGYAAIAYATLQPPTAPDGGECDLDPTYRFYPKDDVMNSGNLNFTPMQIHIMNQYIANYLKEKGRGK